MVPDQIKVCEEEGAHSLRKAGYKTASTEDCTYTYAHTVHNSLEGNILLRCSDLFLGSRIWYFFKDFIYFLFERGEEREKEREKNTDARKKQLLVASCLHPDRRLNPRPRHVP